jgi:hypothetical protein
MGYENWSIRMDRDGADFTASTDEYLSWARGQASLDLANGWATGLPLIRAAARRMLDRIEGEINERLALDHEDRNDYLLAQQELEDFAQDGDFENMPPGGYDDEF